MGLLRDCTTSPINRFAALVVMLSHLAQLEQLKMYKHNTAEPSRDWD